MENFKAQGGVRADLENFDFDARCEISGFRLVRVPKRQDPEFAVNPGGKFKADARRLMDKAKAGDRFFFENVKCKCPGDRASRKTNELVFTIK